MPPAPDLILQFSDAAFQFEHAADGLQGHPLVHEVRHVLHDGDLAAGVAALASCGPGRLDNTELVQTAQKGLLDLEHVRHLADGE